MKQYLIGIDVGTSGCKAAVFNLEGNVIAQKTCEYPVYFPESGFVEQDPEDWWQAVCSALKAVISSSGISPEDISGIGVDGQSWSCIPVDRDGKLLGRSAIWMDTRAAGICEELNQSPQIRNLFELTGNPLQPSYTTGKILWLKRMRPEIYQNTYRILQSNSYIVYRLTGEMTQDVSQGYALHCFDVKKGKWDSGAADLLGIDLDMLPEPKPCHEVVGELNSSSARLTGLRPGTPVVAGGLDAACGTLGAGVINSGETQEQGGQAGGMSICLKKYKADPRLIMGQHVVPEKWLLQGGTVGGGGALRWFSREFCAGEMASGQTGPYALLDKEAEEINPGCDGLIFLPYLSGERSPIWDPHAKGVYFGIDYAKTRGHFIRATLEGVAFSLRHNLEVAHEAGAEVSVMNATGGAANSRLWTQIKADVTGKAIRVPSSDNVTALGAAILAGVGTGVYSSFEEAVSAAVQIKSVYEPDPSIKGLYNGVYEKYLKLYENLKELMAD